MVKVGSLAARAKERPAAREKRKPRTVKKLGETFSLPSSTAQGLKTLVTSLRPPELSPFKVIPLANNLWNLTYYKLKVNHKQFCICIE
jgi:hypothetical protein